MTNFTLSKIRVVGLTKKIKVRRNDNPFGYPEQIVSVQEYRRLARDVAGWFGELTYGGLTIIGRPIMYRVAEEYVEEQVH